MIASVIAILAAGITASDAPPSPGAPPPKPAAAAKLNAANDPNHVICKTILPTGSRLGGTRTCKTKAAWDDEARLSREATETQQSQSFNGGGR